MQLEFDIKNKENRENFFQKAFSSWNEKFLPTKIKTHQLKIVNHHLKLNSQLKHFAKNANGTPVTGECTFCKIKNENRANEIPNETYRHFFLECETTKNLLLFATEYFKVPRPNSDLNGELLMYFFPRDDIWEERRINIFYSLFRYYLTSCKYANKLPTNGGIEFFVKSHIRNIILSNPVSAEIKHRFIPLWSGKEISEEEIRKITTTNGSEDWKSKVLHQSGKRTLIIETRTNFTYTFPVSQANHHLLQLVSNFTKIHLKNNMSENIETKEK